MATTKMNIPPVIHITVPETVEQHQQQQQSQQQLQSQSQQLIASSSRSLLPTVTATATAVCLREGPLYEDEYAWERDPYAGSPESKYQRYELPVAHDEGDRAMSIKLCSCKRPHMRALHCAWISFFLAFTIWFAPAPLLKEIGSTLKLSKQQLWNSSIANDISAITMRIIIGPFCDAYGARIPMSLVLIVASIPCSCIGFVQTSHGLSITRFFIGIAGSSFVMSQFWPSRMFARELAGTANGIVGGWGNVGGAFTQLIMGRILFPLFKNHVYDGDPEKAWRIICIFPAFFAFCWGCILWTITDDAPVGNYNKMRKNGTMDRLYFTTGMRSGAKMNTWILYIQYACCFGVEIVMNNGTVLYFTSEYNLSTEDASLLGFAFGSMNLVFRGFGGYISDQLNLRYGLRGRLWLQAFLLFMEGIVIILFSTSKGLSTSIMYMIIFSIFVQAAEGAIFGVVPYVSKLYTGSVSGLVGSGGNVGSVVYGFLFRSLPYRTAFFVMGTLVVLSSFLTIFLKIPCHAGMFFGEDNAAIISTRQRFMSRRDNVEYGATTYGPNNNNGTGAGINHTTTTNDTKNQEEKNKIPLQEEEGNLDYDHNNNNNNDQNRSHSSSSISNTIKDDDDDK